MTQSAFPSSDTIAAIVTSPLPAGVSIVRLSGADAIAIADGIFLTKSGKRILKNAPSHTLHYGYIYDTEAPPRPDIPDKSLRIDEVLVSVMRAPRSYTTEDVVEINCHGGTLATRRVLRRVLKNGARLAERGEFTKRAFLGGRIDLSEAEAVMDLVSAKSDFAASASLKQLGGALSEKIAPLREDILRQVAFIEAAIDDPEHISLDGFPERLSDKLGEWSATLNALLSSFDDGRLLREGIKTVILGKPNAGKSSFLNALLGEDRAIVTEYEGTTRDTLEETLSVGGLLLRLIDTAGIRGTDNPIEQLGVERAFASAKDADLLLFFTDASRELDENDRKIADFICSLLDKTTTKDAAEATREAEGNAGATGSSSTGSSSAGKKCMVLLNKSDLEARVSAQDVAALLFPKVKISATSQTADTKASFTATASQTVGTEASFTATASQTVGTEASFTATASHIDATDASSEDKRESNCPVLRISAKQRTGLDAFSDALRELFFGNAAPQTLVSERLYLTNERHSGLIRQALESLSLVKNSVDARMPEDFYSIDLMNAYACLGSILGEEVGDDLIEKIFSEFCMGK